MSKKNINLVNRVQKHNKKFEFIGNMIKRNIERNSGDRTMMADDNGLIDILANYRI